ALARDGFRCMLSGEYDLNSAKRNPAIRSDTSYGRAHTNCCHILSESTLQDADPDNLYHDSKRSYAATVLAVLESFGLKSIVAEVTRQNGIHHLSNVLTMITQFHQLFDSLHLWLEATNTPSEYKICVADEGDLSLYALKTRTVRFEVHVPGRDDLPLPDPRLLAVHAACARVVHMSGAAEYMDKCDRDAEDMQVLAEDGSSSAVLLEQLQRIAILAS
ncbi:uncharacterized protein PHACADRAFT_261937, partial [Phanerochaete carnosa HHB-10118-sp]